MMMDTNVSFQKLIIYHFPYTRFTQRQVFWWRFEYW